MEWATTTLALYGMGGAALATSLVTLRRRLELSRAKHASLAGQRNRAPARGPGAVLRIRRGAILQFRRSARRHCRAPPRRVRAALGALCDALCRDHPVQRRGRRQHFRPAVHRRVPRAVPVQPLCARPPAFRRLRAVERRRDRHRSRRQPFLRPHRLLRCERPRLRLLQGGDRARRRPGARARAGARPLSSFDR